MPCTDCTPKTVITYSNPIQNTSNCNSQCDDIKYTGANLTCSTIATGDGFTTVIQKIDSKLCSVLGDYSTYNTYCLAPISTEKEFVESISNKYCTLKSAYDTFISTTYPGDISDINDAIDALNAPEITSSCSALNITDADNIKQVLSKLTSALCAVYSTALDLSTVNWGSCFTVSPIPSTIQGGFNTIISQICSIKNSLGALSALPVFDNGSSCIGGTAEDTLSETIDLIKTRLCSTPTFNINSINWGCTSKPSTTNTDIQAAVQSLVSAVNTLKAKIPVFDSSFTTTPNGCAGVGVSLSTGATSDKYVASTSSDSSPGTLEDKLEEGSNITIDFATTPGKAIISSSAGATSDEKVKAYSGDDTSGYLDEKVEGDTSGIVQTTITQDLSTKKVKISASYDAYDLMKDLLTTLAEVPTDDPLFKLFCQVKNRCGQQCNPPSAISVSYVTV